MPYYQRTFDYTLVNELVGAPAPDGLKITFTHTVLGTDPKTGGVATTLKVRLIPIDIFLPNGSIIATDTELVPGVGQTMIDIDRFSPLFQAADIPVGKSATEYTQLLDAWVRSGRWKDVATQPGYHLYLSATVGPTLGIRPNASQIAGTAQTMSATGAVTAWRNYALDPAYLQQQMQAYLALYPLALDTIPVFVTGYNVLNPGAIGYHNNWGPRPFIWHSLALSTVPAPATPDVRTLEHELAEMIDHPFPSSETQNEQVGPCALKLPLAYLQGYESGDPLTAGQGNFKVNGYLVQDLVYPAYTEGTYPSDARGQLYTMRNAFKFPCSFL